MAVKLLISNGLIKVNFTLVVSRITKNIGAVTAIKNAIIYDLNRFLICNIFLDFSIDIH